MGLLEGFRHYFEMVPVVHEVTAGICAEHFNEVSQAENKKAFCLITTGPGLTNILTAVASAYCERRELLVIAGQVKSGDRKSGTLRQRGVQEVDGANIVQPVSVHSQCLTKPINYSEFSRLVQLSKMPHPGPVLIEICLDVQNKQLDEQLFLSLNHEKGDAFGQDKKIVLPDSELTKVLEILSASYRPLILIGGLVSRKLLKNLWPHLEQLGVPLMTVSSSIDRVPSDSFLYAGRPGTWGGQRSANILVAQCDCLIACGVQLDLQQTGFNWQKYAPMANIVQIYPDTTELEKGHPELALGINCSPDKALTYLAKEGVVDGVKLKEWHSFIAKTRNLIPDIETCNETASGFVPLFDFLQNLSAAVSSNDIIASASSGGAFTGYPQVARVKKGQIHSCSPALASMGFGLAAAIGAAFTDRQKTVVHFEGDGGFAQNLQELALLKHHNLNIKIFIMCNGGYASIRLTQMRYFGGVHVGCNEQSGLPVFDWAKIFEAFHIPVSKIDSAHHDIDDLSLLIYGSKGPAAFLVPIDPEQTNYPSVYTKINEDGSLVSSPLYDQQPPLSREIADSVFRHLPPPEG